MKFTKIGQTRLLGVLTTCNFVCERRLCPRRKNYGGELLGELPGDSVRQNLDVPEVPFVRVKFHKNVNFSALASHWLLKLDKSPENLGAGIPWRYRARLN